MPANVLLWVLRSRFRFKTIRRRTHRGASRASKIEHAALREDARTKILERLEYFNQHYQHSWAKLVVRNQRTRWGSCSKSGTLSFNYRLIKLRPELLDYVVVHELCHLSQFNHSAAFWALVHETIPQWKHLRAELKGIRL